MLGVTDDGAPLHLDLKESARGGAGPHGLVVGATGSGKSELLRTLVLGLVLGHPPDLLNLVLVDFKGGATFAGLGPLPHVAAAVTNLADDLALVDRMQDALAGRAAPAPGAAPRRPASPPPTSTRGPARPARTCRRCRRCSSWSTSSPRC